MQMMRQIYFIGLLAAALAGLAMTAHGEALSMVSTEDEMVMGINARQIVDSPLFQQFMKSRPRIKSQLDSMQEQTGINILADVDKVFIYGKGGGRPMRGMGMGPGMNVGMVLKGRINPEQVIAKIRINDQFSTTSVYGLTVYSWMNGTHKIMQYGAFLPDSTTIYWSSKEVMERSIKAVRDKSIQMLAQPEGKLIPDEDDKSTAWIIAFNREGGRAPQNFQFTQLRAFLAMSQQDVQARVTVIPKNPEDVENWVQMIQGAVMLWQFQDNNTLLQELAQRTRVRAGANGQSLEMSTALDLKNVLDMITGKRNLDDDDN